MKTNIIWLFIATLVVALVYYLSRQPQIPQQAAHKKASDSEPLTTNAVNNSVYANAALKTSEQDSQANTVNGNSNITELKAAQLQQVIAEKNIPVKLYGMVVDQENQPISGVRMVMHVRHADYLISKGIKTTYPQTDVLTDSAGRFEWTSGASGDVLNVESVTKDGYTLSAKAPRFFYPSSGSLENPVVIKMWKLGEAQQLISHHLTRIGIPVDGQPVQFDLVNGKKVSSGGQLTVRLKRDPQILPPRYGRYDWSLELEIPNGGLGTNYDEFMYQAPEGSYQKIFKFVMPKNAEHWTTALDQQFYIRLENGKYFGSLVVRLNTIHDTPPLGINLDIVINPSGSRSLQP